MGAGFARQIFKLLNSKPILKLVGPLKFLKGRGRVQVASLAPPPGRYSRPAGASREGGVSQDARSKIGGICVPRGNGEGSRHLSLRTALRSQSLKPAHCSRSRRPFSIVFRRDSSGTFPSLNCACREQASATADGKRGEDRAPWAFSKRIRN